MPSANSESVRLRRRVRHLLLFFMLALSLSGITAFPLVGEVALLHGWVGTGTAIGNGWPALAQWIDYVQQGLTATQAQFPFLFYGTDWLAFAHLVIALAFVGPLRDPVRNVWVVEWGMMACVLVLPLALICGPLRGIPAFWRMLDCSFGVLGIVPLWLTRRAIGQLARVEGTAITPVV